MAVRSILLLSIALNLVMGAMIYSSHREGRLFYTGSQEKEVSAAPTVRTNVVVRRQYFSWKEIESPDYHIYVANLREIGVPESTIRDIILADVNELFARRRIEEIDPIQQPWWRAEPEPEVIEEFQERVLALEGEREALLAELLGPDWNPLERTPPHEEGAVFESALDGPVLGELNDETRSAVREVETRALERYQDYLNSLEEGVLPDTTQLARIEQETRAELALVLSPPELEEYLLHYSQTARQMRHEFRGADLRPDEFRALFRLRDPIEQQIRLHYSGGDPASVKLAARLEEQLESMTRQILGPERFQISQIVRDPMFQQTQTSIERIGAPPEAVLPVYEVHQATHDEMLRIQADPNLDTIQQAAALEAVRLQQEEMLRTLLGEEVYGLYRQAYIPAPGPPGP